MKVLYVVIMLMLVVSPAYAQDGCGLASRLQMGRAGQVTPGDANNVRDAAERSGVLLGQIEGGQAFGVLSESTCADGLTWIEVEFLDNGTTIRGWTVEATSDAYLVDPLDGAFFSWADGDMSISLVVPTEIASDVDITFVEREEPEADNPYSGTPAYAEITFSDDYPDTDYRQPYDAPQIQVYVVATTEGIEAGIIGGTTAYIAEALEVILAEQPDLSEYRVIDNNLPDFTLGAATSLLAFLDYWDFGNGEGMRFMSYYSQMLIGPSNTGLLYRYQGLTADGVYLINASLPVDAPRMPTEFDRRGEFEEFALYAADMAVFFESFAMDEYTPNLTLLDAMIATLWIE